jgi:hypothetical protein
MCAHFVEANRGMLGNGLAQLYSLLGGAIEQGLAEHAIDGLQNWLL